MINLEEVRLPVSVSCRRRGLMAVILGGQVTDARALLGWTARELARRAHVRVFAVELIEQATGPTKSESQSNRAVNRLLRRPVNPKYVATFQMGP
jgi:hypothetical protein